MRAPARAATFVIRAITTIAAAAGVGCGGSSGSADAAVEAGAGVDGADAGLSRCPTGLAGPDLVLVRWSDGIAFCIDSSEITNAHYGAFLAANVALDGQTARCQSNLGYAPGANSTNGPACPAFDPVARADFPVVCVDWCDAAAYCGWAGKHLCRQPGPQTGTVVDFTAKNASEWVIACTGDRDDGTMTRFPYGPDPVSGRCVDRLYPMTTPALLPVKQATGCEGGYPGLFDMSGNAWEWQDDCAQQPGDGMDDACTPLGGSFSTDAATSSCTDGAPFLRKQVAGDTGFRCCADAGFSF
jgi:formylglycine-generating enzyme